MPNITMSWDESVGGWTSEFSFVPDSGLSLNNKYYTFKEGQMWQHNDSTLARNNFYGIQSNTVIEFVFNHQPTVVKNFKTLSYEGEGTWTASIDTNLEEGQVTRFITKEGKNYSWIEGSPDAQYEDIDYASNAVQGIGTLTSIDGNVLTFGTVPSFLGAGDVLYRVETLTTSTFTDTPELIGVVESKTDTTITTTTDGIPGLINNAAPVIMTPVVGDFIMYIKDNRQEKSGIIGYYSTVTMTNEDTTQAEIFSVNSNSFITTI